MYRSGKVQGLLKREVVSCRNRLCTFFSLAASLLRQEEEVERHANRVGGGSDVLSVYRLPTVKTKGSIVSTNMKE